MVYENTVPFDGDVGQALDTAMNTILPHGFRIINRSDSTLEAVGPGTLWTKGQDPLVGVSKLSISVPAREIRVDAELGGVTKIIKYLTVFIVAMAVFFLILFGFIFGQRQGADISKVIWMSLAPFVPWPVVIPLMAMWLKSRTCKALDTLEHNMVVLAK
jgi:hypothetical protein